MKAHRLGHRRQRPAARRLADLPGEVGACAPRAWSAPRGACSAGWRAAIDAFCRATIPPATTRKSSSQKKRWCRPLTCIVHLEDPEARAAGARVRRRLRIARHDRATRHERTRGLPAADADGQSRRTGARRAPGTERLLHESVLSRMIADHGQAATRQRARSRKACEGPRESAEFVVHRDAETPGRSGRTRPGPLRGPSTARMALTRSSLDANGARSRRRTISRAIAPAFRSSA